MTIQTAKDLTFSDNVTQSTLCDTTALAGSLARLGMTRGVAGLAVRLVALSNFGRGVCRPQADCYRRSTIDGLSNGAGQLLGVEWFRQEKHPVFDSVTRMQ
jgi:hypothetical protein